MGIFKCVLKQIPDTIHTFALVLRQQGKGGPWVGVFGVLLTEEVRQPFLEIRSMTLQWGPGVGNTINGGARIKSRSKSIGAYF